MVFLASYFNTIRAVAGQREPVVLEIVLRNTEEESKLMSVMIKIPFDLGFDSTGLMRETRRRLGYVGAGEEKKIPIALYCKRNIKEGVYPIEVTAYIHPDKYDKSVKSFPHKTQLRVISV
jgi:uncharacterized membrane protein